VNKFYDRLIFLAEDSEAPSTVDKILELNELLSNQNIDCIKDSDLQILDDIIAILSNTNNLLEETRDSIINLQEEIRKRIYK